MPWTTSWNDSSIFSWQVYLSTQWFVVCTTLSVISCVVHPIATQTCLTDSLNTAFLPEQLSQKALELHSVLEKGISFWTTSALFPCCRWVQHLEGAASWPLGVPATEVTRIVYLASLRNQKKVYFLPLVLRRICQQVTWRGNKSKHILRLLGRWSFLQLLRPVRPHFQSSINSHVFWDWRVYAYK